MSTTLYTLDILRLAAATGDWPRLAKADVHVERRSATCGSRLIVDVAFGADGRVAAYGQAVHACALGQAASTLFARHVVGRSAAELDKASCDIARWLAEPDASIPEWPGIAALERAREYPARHSAIRLPFEAAAAAMRQIAA